MKRTFLFLAFLTGALMARPAAACSPPVFPRPENVILAMAAQEEGAVLPVDETQLLEDYRKDKDRYFALYDAANPCPTSGTAHMSLTSDEQEEMAALAEKWRAVESAPADPETTQIYYDVPDDALVHME